MAETMELVETPAQQPQPVALQPTASPAAIMQLAIQQGAPVETIERMWALQVAWEEREAKKAFVDAMAEFKKNPPVILKDKNVNFTTQKGTTDYYHATHFGVTSAIVAALSQHGISHRWVPEQSAGKVAVTCVLTHKLGHSESTRLEAEPDQSGGKNSIQAVMSAKTYLERHTLLAATGLSTSDMQDDDGRGAGSKGGISPDALAEEARQGWIDAIKQCTSAESVQSTWLAALTEIGPMNRLDVHQAVKKSVTDRLAQLRGGAQ